MDNKIISPFSKSIALLEEEIDTSKIINLYKDQYQFDVSRHFNGIDKVGIYADTECGFRFYHPATIMGDGEFYKDLQLSGMDYYHKWNWQNKWANKFIREESNVLEIGSGDGSFLQGLIKRKNTTVIGLEINPEAIKVSKSKGIETISETVEVHAKQNEGKYDVVVSFQVLEHIYKTHDYLEASLKCLKPDGLMIIAVPNNNPYLYRFDKFNVLNLPPHHMGLWGKASMTGIAEKFDLRIISLKVQPVDDFRKYLSAYFKHKGLMSLNKWLFKIPYIFFKALSLVPVPFIEGRDIIGVYQKK